jgi:hypothetical protein
MTTQSTQIQENRFFFVKCRLFDEARIGTSAAAIRSASFAVSSTSSIKAGLNKVKASPFKTVFVIDEQKDKAIFALTQNPELEAEAKKKGGGGNPPPPPPPIECQAVCAECEAAGGQCIVDATSCWCVVFEDSPQNIRHRTPFTADDSLASLLQVFK